MPGEEQLLMQALGSGAFGNGGDSFGGGTGNKALDLFAGGLTGFADATQKKGYYIPMSNWAGNGLARTGVQYMANPDYRDYASGGRMLGAGLSGRNKKQNGGSDTFGSMKERLSTMLGQPIFGNDSGPQYALKTQEYQLPQIGDVGGGSIGGYGDIYNQQSYRLPTQDFSFNKFWE